MLDHISGELRLTAPQLAPGDFAIVIRIDSDSQLGIAERELYRAADPVAFDVENEEPTAGNVGRSRLGQHQHEQYSGEAFHFTLAR
jgi:hypothetical protein